MLEDQVAYLLQRYLGNYVRGLNKEALKISVWQGDVELTNMQLKPEALNALKLPVKVKAGFLGSVKLKGTIELKDHLDCIRSFLILPCKSLYISLAAVLQLETEGNLARVPWSRLGQDPVLVYLDRIFLLAEPATQIEGSSEDAVQEAKKIRIQEMEMKLLEKAQQLKSEMNKSWLGSLINTIIGNLKLSISNIHIRYEDLESNPGHPFAAGVTLQKLSAVTVDDSGKETFVTGGALDRIQKSVELDELALYLDSDVSPWQFEKPWENLLPSEWVQVFRFGTKDGKPAGHLTRRHAYILQPVSGNAKYSKMRSGESVDDGQPIQKVLVNLDDVTLCLSKDGYRDALKLADNFAAFNHRLKYAHYRPYVSVKCDPRSWWKYVCKAVSDEMKKGSGRLSWDQVLKYARLRKRYISLYASLLKSDVNRQVIDDNEEIEELDRELDIEVILQWRMLAHKFVQRSAESENYLKKQKSKQSWWSFGWKSQSVEDESEPVHFTGEDWEQLNKVIGYKEGDEQSATTNEKPDTLHVSLEVFMRHNASKLFDGEQQCLAEMSCEGLNCSVKLYPETKLFNMKLGSYRLSSPSGLLAESAASFDSLVAIFCYKPFDAKVDWSLVAKASPCYMIYLKDSIDGIVNFFESNAAVSQTIALETAAAVQMTIDEVKRTAQQQVNRALKNRARFQLDLDIAAPKITIPTEFRPDNIHSTNLLLDLGNLIICSQDDYECGSSEELDMYLQFDMIFSDMSAFLVDGEYSWNQAVSNKNAGSANKTRGSFLPVIDKCGVVLKFQQIHMPNQSYPSTRLAVRLPTLGFHFSPARYHRLMQVVQIFQVKASESSNLLRPWDQADFEGWLSLLIWKGREAVWQRRYFCLVGPFLYVLENLGSNSYKKYMSLRGKQIYQVPEDLVGGVEHVLAVSDTSRSNNKVVEDINALILRCNSIESRQVWQSRLQGAAYRASGSAPIASLSDTSTDTDGSEIELNDTPEANDLSKVESFCATGMLDELKVSFNYSHQINPRFMKVLLAKESQLFEFRAVGGQVELSIRGNDMFIGTMLKSLEIEDLVCCNGLSQPCYLARSFIRSSDACSSFEDTGNQSLESSDPPVEGGEKFYEASENLVDSVDYALQTPKKISENLGPLDSLQSRNFTIKTPSFSHVTGLLPVDTLKSGQQGIEATEMLDSFVKAQIVFHDKSSPQYENIDNLVTVTLATLSFFCRRPTILAIMEFVNAISIEEETCESFDDNSPASNLEEDISQENVMEDQHLSASEEPTVKGLLGKGKSRIIFNLTLNMARAQILLMNENETRFATLSQDNLLTDIKVFPSSFSIKAALGNLRISDDSLPNSHMYFWICDMRDPQGTSFVELNFTSFSADDNDYEGYDYFLFGQLSEVRIVYLNRFVQEVVHYFMGLVPNNPKGVVRLKDQVTNSEKWFTTSEIEGSPALKLDLSLRKPIILMPRCTDSLDFLKLDIVHITVQNTFKWSGGNKNELGAVHLELLMIMVEQINLNVGTGSELGENIIQDVKGVSVVIQRALRDLLHQVPSLEATIKIDELRAAVSNMEYQIVTECAQSNISETPHIVPPLNNYLVTSADAVEPMMPKDPVFVESETSTSEAWITMKVSVIINLVELCLYTGVSRDASLATVQISGAWLLYRSNSHDEGFVSATLKGFTVIDDREGTEEEFRLAIGKPKDISYGALNSLTDDRDRKVIHALVTEGTDDKLIPTMLIFDAKFGQFSTFLSVCIQRPQLLVALDFLLAIVEFFVPTVGNMLSSGEDKKYLHDDAIIVDQSTYTQPTAEFSLSPHSPLIVEDERFDHFIYDGEGGILYLKDRHGFCLSSPSSEAMIYVGNGKSLQFKNVVIKSGQYLDYCISLGTNSRYSASWDDGVYFEVGDGPHVHSVRESSNVSLSQTTAAGRSMEFIIDLQAIGPELTFYTALKDVGDSPILRNKLLHAQLDAFGRLVLRSETTEVTANVLGLAMESNGIQILEPFDTYVKYSNASRKTNIHLSISEIFMNFSFRTLRLFLAVEEDILEFLRMTSKKMTIVCSQFDKVGTVRNPDTGQEYAFWRPHAPPGFAVLGDYLTPLDKPPTKGVLVVNTNVVRVKRALSFRLIWPLPLASEDISNQPVTAFDCSESIDLENRCSVWFPDAPKGYVALGCVVSTGRTQPSRSSAFCILASSVSPCSLRDCVTIGSRNICASSLLFWRVDNCFGTFLLVDPRNFCLLGRAYDLRRVFFGVSAVTPRKSRLLDQASQSGDVQTLKSEVPSAVNSALCYEPVASFHLIWWNRDSGSRKKLSVWHPVVPQGMVYFGDVAVRGYEPPNTCIVLRNDGDEEVLKAPLGFQIVGKINKQKGMENISFWLPQAPPGFVSLGCVAFKGTPKEHDFSTLRCVRSDMVTGDQFFEESVWDTSDVKLRSDPFSIWSVVNELNTFIIRSGFKKPPRRFALKLADRPPPSGTDSTVIDAEIRTFSAALFDDYSGLMVPLFNLSLSKMTFSLHGRADYMNSTISFSLAARSYNDKYDSWEPLIEPVDGFLRYQYDPNVPGATSQLRLTSMRDLNLNISVFNANMIIQAYASWHHLTNVHDHSRKREALSSPLSGRSIIDIHEKRNYFIIPQNKLGQDIFIRASEIRGSYDVTRLPSGDMKPVKVPVSKNMLDSHFREEELSRKGGTMVAVAIKDGQFPGVAGLASHQYTVAIHLTQDQSFRRESFLHQQSARTSGSISSYSCSELEVVNWSEIFFFKVDSPEFYMLELIVTDMGRGDPIGFFSVPLNQIAERSDQYAYVNGLTWVDLSSAEYMRMTQEDKSKKCGKIQCAVVMSPKSDVEDNNESFFVGSRKSGLIQISPSMEGPWTTVKLNYATAAACWRLGSDVVASQVSVKDGNRYVTIRSLVAVCNNTDLLLDLCLVPKADTTKQEIHVGLLNPGKSVSLPLSGLTQHGLYILKIRPAGLDDPDEYSWSSVVAKSGEPGSCEEICVSTLTQSEDLLCCNQMNGSSSRVPYLFWFCISTQAVEIAKDIHSELIQDWTILVKSPLSITNYLPLESEYSVLEKQATGHFLICNRGIFGPGRTVNVYYADIRNPLFFSLFPQKGWLPIHEAVMISHPQGIPSKTIGFRSSVSGRIVQVILEQHYDKDQPLLPKIIRVYSPYWFAIARCPPLTLRLLDLTAKRQAQKIGFPFQYKKNKEIFLEEINEEEIYEGHTIASALNFKFLGLSVSVAQSDDGQYGPVEELSPLGDMDGSLDLYAYAADGKCMRLFVSTKPCPYQSVPTKVISVRPFLTFTNRFGEDIYIKLSSKDEPKMLRAVDSRVSFMYHESGGREELQVCLEDTEWSFPVQIVKEDTITLVLRRHNGSRRFLRTEIRGFEEGSRFIVVFRLGSTNGPIRIENRTSNKTISIRQSGFGDNAWTQLESLSTTNFSWEDPYGQKVIDARIDSGCHSRICKIDMENIGLSSELQRELGMQFHVVETGDIKVLKFTNDCTLESSGEEISSIAASGDLGNSQLHSETEYNIKTLELIVELGVVGVSVIDHKPKELSYLYLEKVFVSYSTGYDCGTTSRFKLILAGLLIDNMLPLTVMPVLLAPEQMGDTHHPVFKMTITMHNEDTDGIKVFPYVYIRVTEKPWRLNIHEPIIWALVDFYSNLQLDRIPKSSDVSQVDPEIRIDLIDVSEVRLKVSLETAPAERPHGVLGVWSPILSAVGNAFKIQVHLRRVMHRDRFMRQSSIIPAISNRIWRDLIHNPLHLIFSVDVLGMTSSTLASLSKGFAELSTDGQFLQLRSKQVWSRRITGVSDGIIQGTEALAQGVAFGVSGVVTKPVESARQNGLLGLAHGLGRAFLGFIVQPVSGALDFFSLTVDGIGASCSKCLEVLNNRTSLERVRNPRAIHGDGVLREYCEKEAVGQMTLYLAEESRHFGCTEIFKEPAKFAWSDLYEEHFIVPYQRIVLVTNKRVMLLQCPNPEKMDKKPSKIMWDVPWEELMALELAKAGCPMPSHLILHLKDFRRSENFVHIIKCSVEEVEGTEPQAVRICSVVRKMWKAYQSDIKCLTLKVPSSQRFVHFSWNVSDGKEPHTSSKAIINSRDLSSSSSISYERKFVKHAINFSKIWSSERESRGRCGLCRKQVSEDEGICSIWRPICPDGFISIGDIAHVGSHPPNVAAVYHYSDRLFARPVGYDLVWRNCSDDYITPVSIWHPRAPEGFVSPGCVIVASFSEPEPDTVHCVVESLAEETVFEEQKAWFAPDSYPWACHIYQVQSDALHFVALRQTKEESDWKPMRVIDDPEPQLRSVEAS